MDYRKQVYNHYVSTQEHSIAPAEVSGFKQRSPYLNRIIRRHFPQNKHSSIFELGCGHGAFIYFIRQAGYTNVWGVDISPEQVAEAERLGIEGVEQGDVIKTLQQMEDNTQNVVIAFDVIEHFTKEELQSLGHEVYRVLKKEGKWIIHTLNGEGLFGSRIYFGDFTHQTGFTRSSITQFLKTTNFSEVNCYEDKVVIHGLKSAVRSVIWKGIRFVLRIILAAETGSIKDDYILTQNFLTVAVK